jgi:hypothetical protein
MDNQQLENGAKSVLDSSNEVEILPYEAFLPFLKDLSNTMKFTKESVRSFFTSLSRRLISL